MKINLPYFFLYVFSIGFVSDIILLVLSRVKLKFKKISKESKIYDKGDRVGQIMIIPRPFIEFEESEVLSSTFRGEGGFGSTGT